MCEIASMKIHRRCKTPEEPCVVYIVWKSENVGICKRCWEKFPEDLEWGNTPRPTMEQILSEESRVGKNPTLTEYKERGLTQAPESEEEADET